MRMEQIRNAKETIKLNKKCLKEEIQKESDTFKGVSHDKLIKMVSLNSLVRLTEFFI